MARNSKKNKDNNKEKDNLTPIIDEPKGPEFEDSSQDQDIADAIEQAKNDGWNQDTQSFFERNKGTVFPFVIFLVIIFVGVGIWMLLNDDSTEEERSDTAQEQSTDKEDSDTKDTDQDDTDDEQTPDTGTSSTPEVSDTSSVAPDRIPPQGVGGESRIDADFGQYTEATQVGDNVMVSAQYGEGITHLARKSLIYWMERNGTSLSDEQRVYAEDYIQNYTGTQWLDLGETLAFDNDLIQEAYTAAQGLADWQIENLSQYT